MDSPAAPFYRDGRDNSCHGGGMSFTKGRDLLRLAEMAAARHGGVSLAEIAETFEADHRTAQRMARALEATFEGVEVRTGEDRRRRWKLRDPGLVRFQGLRDDELAALEMSLRRAEREGATVDRAALASLRDRLLATMPGPHARRAESDAEAMLESQGYAARPGPRVRAAPGVLEVIVEAFKGPFMLAIAYQGPEDAAPRGAKRQTTSASWRASWNEPKARAACASMLKPGSRTKDWPSSRALRMRSTRKCRRRASRSGWRATR